MSLFARFRLFYRAVNNTIFLWPFLRRTNETSTNRVIIRHSWPGAGLNESRTKFRCSNWAQMWYLRPAKLQSRTKERQRYEYWNGCLTVSTDKTEKSFLHTRTFTSQILMLQNLFKFLQPRRQRRSSFFYIINLRVWLAPLLLDQCGWNVGFVCLLYCKHYLFETIARLPAISSFK